MRLVYFSSTLRSGALSPHNFAYPTKILHPQCPLVFIRLRFGVSGCTRSTVRCISSVATCLHLGNGFISTNFIRLRFYVSGCTRSNVRCVFSTSTCIHAGKHPARLPWTEKLAQQHAQNTTFGQFSAASLFRLTVWFHIH